MDIKIVIEEKLLQRLNKTRIDFFHVGDVLVAAVLFFCNRLSNSDFQGYLKVKRRRVSHWRRHGVLLLYCQWVALYYLFVPIRAENGPKIFGPARRPPGPARPVRATTKVGPARPVVLRPGPFRPGKFRELSLQCLRIVFYLFIFLPVISVFRDFLLHYLCFYSIVYVSGNIPEIFITRQRERQHEA
jgi:hypothetical protein